MRQQETGEKHPGFERGFGAAGVQNSSLRVGLEQSKARYGAAQVSGASCQESFQSVHSSFSNYINSVSTTLVNRLHTQHLLRAMNSPSCFTSINSFDHCSNPREINTIIILGPGVRKLSLKEIG